MKYPSNKLAIVILIFIGAFANADAQDIFSFDNSNKYAEYLFKSQEYKLAATEYERILFLDSTNSSAKINLVKSYRFSSQYNMALNRILKYNNNISLMSSDWNAEYLKCNIYKKDYDAVLSFLNNEVDLNPKTKLKYKTITYCLNDSWSDAELLFQNAKIENDKTLNNLKSVITNYNNEQFKNTSLAIGLSTVVPGLGKAYSGYWKDGLFSLIIVGVSGLQAYRGFNKNGVQSTYGWIYLSLGTGFYIGNLYGSVKAVNKRNSQIKHKYIHQVENIFEHIN